MMGKEFVVGAKTICKHFALSDLDVKSMTPIETHESHKGNLYYKVELKSFCAIYFFIISNSFTNNINTINSLSEGRSTALTKYGCVLGMAQVWDNINRPQLVQEIREQNFIQRNLFIALKTEGLEEHMWYAKCRNWIKNKGKHVADLLLY